MLAEISKQRAGHARPNFAQIDYRTPPCAEAARHVSAPPDRRLDAVTPSA